MILSHTSTQHPSIQRSTQRVTRFAWMLTSVALFAGCASGGPPEIADLVVASPVTRGVAAAGSFVVFDDDGLAGIDFDARIEEPLVSPVPFAEPSFPADAIEADVQFALLLADAAPVGRYRMVVTATDVDGDTSDEVTVEFDVQ